MNYKNVNLPQGNKTFKMKFATYYDRPATKGSVNDKPSKTVPNQAMSIDEIIRRTQKGLPVTGVKVPLYNETDDGVLPDLRKLDISELHELKKRMAQAEKDIRKQLAEEEEKRQLEETEAFYRRKFGINQQAEPTEITPTEEA